MSDTNTEQHVVFRTGASVAQIKEHNETLTQQPIATPAPEQVAPEVQQTAETPATVTPEVAAPETPVTEPEKNVSAFKFGDFEEKVLAPAVAPEQPAAQQPSTNWIDEVKKDPKTVLKELGFSDFAIELNDHMKNGGSALDYLNARAIDYNKISDDSLLKDDLKKKYPQFTPSQIDLMFNRKFGVPEDASDEDKEFANIQLQAEAHQVRQQKISEQQKFKIADHLPTDNNTSTQNEAEQLQQLEAARNWYAQHEATKTLMTSKRVALNLGENGTFNFEVSQPEFVTKAITDAGLWQKLTLTKQGEPDVVKMQKLVLYASNPEQFENDLVNYGKTLALPLLLKEGQNIVPPAKVLPIQAGEKGQVNWGAAKTGKIGG